MLVKVRNNDYRMITKHDIIEALAK
jgi:hypothetical protein